MNSIKEGTVIHNPSTGEYKEFRGGQWVDRAVPDYSKAFEQEAPEWTKPVISAGQGMAFNNFDELVGAVAKLHGESYERARDRVRVAAKQFSESNPKTDLTLNVLGSLPSLALPGANVEAGAGVLRKAASILVPAIGYGAVGAAGSSEATTPEQLTGDIGSGALGSGLMASGLGIAGKTAGAIGRGIVERIPEGAGQKILESVKLSPESMRIDSARTRMAQLLGRDVEAKMPGMSANPYSVAKARLESLGERSPIAATGKNVASELDLLASMPGSAETLADREARRISNSRGPTLQAATAQALGTGGVKYNDWVNSVISDRAAKSQPLYKQLETVNVPVDAELQKLLQRSVDVHGLAEKSARVRGEPIDLSEITAGSKSVPFNVLDKLKRSLYDAAQSAKQSGEKNLGYDFDEVRKKLVEKLDSISPKDANGISIYKQAREAFEGPSQLLNAAKSGREAISSDDAVISELISGMSQGELEAFKIGAAQAFKQKLGSQSGQTQIMAFPKNSNINERINLIFGKDAREFKKSLLQEAELKKLERAGQGSQSFKRFAGSEDQAKALEVAHDVVGAATAPATIPGKMMQWGTQLAMPEQTRNQLAKLLLLRGKGATDELNALEQYMLSKAGTDRNKRMASALAGEKLAE